jgi:hypothetical protein
MNTTLVGCRGDNGLEIFTVVEVVGSTVLLSNNTGSYTTDIALINNYSHWIWIPEVGQIWANTEAERTLKIVSKTSWDGIYNCVDNNTEEYRLVQIAALQKNYVLLGFPVDTQVVPTLDIQESQTNLSEGDALLKFFATPTGQWKGYNND